MLDASGIMFWRWSPQFMVAVGAQYWERINNLVIPYGGFVYTPNEYLEFRIILPKPRVSVFLGTPWGIPTWAYAQGEYHVEAFQLGLSPAAGQTLTQFSDYRVLGGLRFDAGWLSTYAEAGYIFNRDVKFHRIQQNFSINNGFIARIGLRY